jgi:hypothetical protein
VLALGFDFCEPLVDKEEMSGHQAIRYSSPVSDRRPQRLREQHNQHHQKPPEAGRQALENEVRGDCQVDCGDGDVQVRSDGGEGGEVNVRCEARDCEWGCETRLRAQLVGWGLQVAAVEARKTTRAFWRGEKMPYGSSERRVWFGCAGWLEGDMGCSEVFGVIGEAVKSWVVILMSGCENCFLLRAALLLYTAERSSAECTVVERWVRS